MTNNVYLASKPRYEILDGLRGVASVLVILFHLFETYSAGAAEQIINHGYLAVDFFFVLSGFVIGYAYDDRWDRMSVGGFFKRRLIRLHPMVIMGTVIGASLYQRAKKHENMHIPWRALLSAIHHTLSVCIHADALGVGSSGCASLRAYHGCRRCAADGCRDGIRLPETLRHPCPQMAHRQIHETPQGIARPFGTFTIILKHPMHVF